MTPTIHAKFRYATRILGMNFKEERLYRDWQKKNEEEDVRIKNEILDVFNSSEFVYEGKIGETNDISKYYVNLDKMITFVIDCKNNCIITCYDIFFDMGDEVDKQTAKILLKEIRKLQRLIKVTHIESGMSVTKHSRKSHLEAKELAKKELNDLVKIWEG